MLESCIGNAMHLLPVLSLNLLTIFLVLFHQPTDLVPGFLPMAIPITLLLKKTPFQWTTVTPGTSNYHDVAFTHSCPILPRFSTTLYVKSNS